MARTLTMRDLVLLAAGLAIIAGGIGTWGSGWYTSQAPLGDPVTEFRVVRGFDEGGVLMSAPGVVLLIAPLLWLHRRVRAVVATSAAAIAAIPLISAFMAEGRSVIWMHFEIFGDWETWSYSWGLPLVTAGVIVGVAVGLMEYGAATEDAAPLPA